ncbi:MAG: hypothetical protein NTY36_03450 [Deltaproteobacteria bacterium]|nr:hypothetical protein [Deltaproteobacteria bacterium]
MNLVNAPLAPRVLVITAVLGLLVAGFAGRGRTIMLSKGKITAIIRR